MYTAKLCGNRSWQAVHQPAVRHLADPRTLRLHVHLYHGPVKNQSCYSTPTCSKAAPPREFLSASQRQRKDTMESESSSLDGHRTAGLIRFHRPTLLLFSATNISSSQWTRLRAFTFALYSAASLPPCSPCNVETRSRGHWPTTGPVLALLSAFLLAFTLSFQPTTTATVSCSVCSIDRERRMIKARVLHGRLFLASHNLGLWHLLRPKLNERFVLNLISLSCPTLDLIQKL